MYSSVSLVHVFAVPSSPSSHTETLFHLPIQKLFVYWIIITLCFPFSGNHCSTFCLYEFDFSRYLCKLNYVFVLLWLAYFTLHNIFKVHPHCGICQNVLPFQNWIIFHYVCESHFISIRPLVGTWASSTLGSRWIILLRMCLAKFLLLILWGIYGVELLGHMIILCLIFFSNYHIVFLSSYSRNTHRFQILYIITNICFLIFL